MTFVWKYVMKILLDTCNSHSNNDENNNILTFEYDFILQL